MMLPAAATISRPAAEALATAVASAGEISCVPRLMFATLIPWSTAHWSARIRLETSPEPLASRILSAYRSTAGATPTTR